MGENNTGKEGDAFKISEDGTIIRTDKQVVVTEFELNLKNKVQQVFDKKILTVDIYFPDYHFHCGGEEVSYWFQVCSYSSDYIEDKEIRFNLERLGFESDSSGYIKYFPVKYTVDQIVSEIITIIKTIFFFDLNSGRIEAFVGYDLVNSQNQNYTMSIYRKAKYSLSANPFEIYIDNILVAYVPNGQKVEVTVSEGVHHIKVVCKTRKKEFDIDIKKDISILLELVGFLDRLNYSIL
jgi:hypothetical protein